MKELFKMFEVYQGLMPEFYTRLADLAKTIQLAAGEHLLEPGKEAGGMYFLEKGFLWCYTDKIRTAKWYMDRPGLVKTELAYEKGSQYNERIQALEHSVLSYLDKHALAQLVGEFPEFEKIVVSLLEKAMSLNN